MSTNQPRDESTAPLEPTDPTEPTEVIDPAYPTEVIEVGEGIEVGKGIEPNPTLAFDTTPSDDPAGAPFDFAPEAPAAPAASGPFAASAPTTELPAAAAAARVEPESEAKRERPILRVGTVVWGLVLAVIGAGIIAVAAGAQFDLELAFIGLLALSGVGLLAGSLVTSARRRHR